MKNNLIFGILVTCSFLLSCKSDKNSNEGHDHPGHDITLIPYNLNKKYFEIFKTRKYWKTFCSIDNSDNFVPLYISESKRKLFPNDTIIHVLFNVESASNNRSKMMLATDNEQTLDVEIGAIPSYGRHGCNYFLTVDEDSDNQLLPSNSNKSNRCKLDSFMIGSKIYIHLLDVPHPKGVAPKTITKFINNEFPISKQDYIKLDSLIKVHRVVGSGYDSESKSILDIKVDGNHETIFSIKKNVKYYDLPILEHVVPFKNQ